MSKRKSGQKTWLSITSFVLSLVWLLLALTIIGALLWVPLALAGLVFGIIALVKKQKKWLAIAGVVIWGLVTLITATILIVWTIFLRNNSEIIVDPIMEIAEMLENDTELATMMNDPIIQEEFERTLVEKLTVIFAEDIEDGDKKKSRDEIKPMIPIIFDEMENVMLELKEKHSVE